MKGQLSKPSSSSSSNPSSTSTTSDMSSSNSSQTQESNHEKAPTYVSESPEPQASVEGSSDLPVEEPPADLEVKEDGAAPEGEVAGEGEEEEGECPFCTYMKGGGCKEEFVQWEKCVEECEDNKEDIAEKCFEVTSALKKCMEAHRDYYAPLLQAEEEAWKVLEEKGVEREEGNTESEEKKREEETEQSEKEKGIDGSEALKCSDREPEEVKGST